MSKLDVDVVVLTNEITKLKELIVVKDLSVSITGQGKTMSEMQNLTEGLGVVNEAFNHLIQNTIDFLENAKDGYIDADENSKKIFDDLVERCAGK